MLEETEDREVIICARDCERLPAHHEATIYWAVITLMTRRLARTG